MTRKHKKLLWLTARYGIETCWYTYYNTYTYSVAACCGLHFCTGHIAENCSDRCRRLAAAGASIAVERDPVLVPLSDSPVMDGNCRPLSESGPSPRLEGSLYLL